MSIQPFKVNIPQATLDDLHERLGRTRWPDEIEGADWDYGTNLGYLKELANYWQHTFDWSKQEEKLNQFAHFRAGHSWWLGPVLTRRRRRAMRLPISGRRSVPVAP